MPRKRQVGRPRKQEKRSAARAQKANRRARLKQIGLEEVRVWASPERAALLRRMGREDVAVAEYNAVLQEEGRQTAQPFADRIHEVRGQNNEEVRKAALEERRRKSEARDKAWQERRKELLEERSAVPPLFSFQGGVFPR